MSDEFGCLPSEDEFLAGLLLPTSDSILRGRAVEHSVKFGRFELARIVLKLPILGKAVGVKRAPPGIVAPAGCAN